MVKVCDAIMGSGKSSAAITYINEHPDTKFIYITPYLDEAARIKQGCPQADFIEPSNKLAVYQFKKTAHTAALIHEGRNISTTHQAFINYTPEMLDEIRSQGYVLLIDEQIDAVGEYQIHPRDLRCLVDLNLIEKHDGVYRITDSGKAYDGEKFDELLKMMRSRNLVDEREGDEILFFWLLPADLILAFREVYVLTYLFSGQEMRYFFDLHGIRYQLIGVERDGDGVYRFRETPGPLPDYVARLGDLIHVVDDEKLNAIGDPEHALSLNWLQRNGNAVKQLKRNTYNFFRWYGGTQTAGSRLWSTYKSAYAKLRGDGYTKAFAPFNIRATNTYGGRTSLAYLVNIYPNVNRKRLYEKCGVEIDGDAYALSTMVQWIWRSAIRNGKEITLYLPSSRMRRLLSGWIESLREGGNANA